MRNETRFVTGPAVWLILHFAGIRYYIINCLINIPNGYLLIFRKIFKENKRRRQRTNLQSYSIVGESTC